MGSVRGKRALVGCYPPQPAAEGPKTETGHRGLYSAHRFKVKNPVLPPEFLLAERCFQQESRIEVDVKLLNIFP